MFKRQRYLHIYFLHGLSSLFYSVNASSKNNAESEKKLALNDS